MRHAKGPFADADGTRRPLIKSMLSLGSASTVLTKADKEHFMQRALEMRRIAEQRGDQPYGAVIVKDGQVVGEGVSGVIVRRDPTAHGEVEAIRDACRCLGTIDLSGCEIYSTAKPCPMCETACY